MPDKIGAVSAPVQSTLPVHRPVARTVEDTASHYGWTRTYVYLRIADGQLEAVKAGRRTLVITDSAERLLGSLPRRVARAIKHAA